MTVTIRDTTENDLPAIQEIYAEHVLHGLASFEETPPDITEITLRYAAIKNAGHPYRVAVVDGTTKGYAYAAPYRPRPAYQYTVENSIYIAPDSLRQGIGNLLLEDLIKRCTERGYRQMVAVIGDSDNTGSISLHARHGFIHRNILNSVGFKHDRWVDQVIMQLPLGEGDKTLP